MALIFPHQPGFTQDTPLENPFQISLFGSFRQLQQSAYRINLEVIPVRSAGRGRASVADVSKIIGSLLGAVGLGFEDGISLRKVKEVGGNVVDHPMGESSAGSIRVVANEGKTLG